MEGVDLLHFHAFACTVTDMLAKNRTLMHLESVGLLFYLFTYVNVHTYIYIYEYIIPEAVFTLSGAGWVDCMRALRGLVSWFPPYLRCAADAPPQMPLRFLCQEPV